LETRQGSTLTVGLAPLVGAVMLRRPWAVMLVACFGTVDERIPGRRISCDRFFFNRGNFVLVYAIPSLLLAAVKVKYPNAGWYLAQALTVVAIVGINVLTVAVALTLLRGSNFWATAKNTVENSWLTYIALPVVGYLIYLLLQAPLVSEKLAVFLLSGPLLGSRGSPWQQNRLDRGLRDSYLLPRRLLAP